MISLYDSWTIPRMDLNVTYEEYSPEYLEDVIRLIENDLSEPYSIFTYHYFLQERPRLCRIAWHDGTLVGVVIGKIGNHRGNKRGYIGMLAVDSLFRGRGIGLSLASQIVNMMNNEGVAEIVLETEGINAKAQRLYSKLGFVKEKRIMNYYMNGSDAFRMKLWIN